MLEKAQEAAAAADEDVPTVGQVLAGKYVVERVIGQGGMGSVVAARHVELGQHVAVKFLRAEVLGQQAAVERFLREARAVVSIKSEHVAKVSDVGKLENGAPYMVMEYLTGRDLGDILASGTRITMAEAIDYVVQAAEAIAEAHSLGIVHRDLKPTNLFLTRRADGSALIKVLDFGIAKAIPKAQDHSLTATGSALGTPMYMSPEQVRDAKNADPRTDIWGLGTILYELIAGQAPFEADTLPALCAMIVSDPAPSLRDLRPEVPAALDAIVARCLEKQPADRYQTVAQLARDIAPYAPLRCEMILERIVRILEGGEATIGWSQRDSMSETLASQPGATEPPSRRDFMASHEDTVASGPMFKEAATGTPRKPFADTATPTSWGTEEPQPRNRTRLVVAGVAVLACFAGVALWIGSGDDDVHTAPSASTQAGEPPSAAPSPVPPPVPAGPTAEPPATVAPTASAQSASSAAPSANAKRAGQRPGPGGPKPPPPKGSDLDEISDRK